MTETRAATRTAVPAPVAGRLRVVLCGPVPADRLLPDRTPGGGASARPLVLADATGRDASLRDLAAGGADADLAVIAVEAGQGVTARTWRDLYLLGLIGVGRVVLAMCGDQSRAADIARDFAQLAEQSGVDHVATVPVPASGGPTLADYLDGAEPAGTASGAFRFRIAAIGRDEAGAATCTGRVLGGAVGAGDRVRAWPSRAETAVAGVPGPAEAGEDVTLVLAGEIAAAPGDIVAAADDTSIALADQLQATLIWYGAEPMVPGRRYLARFGAAETEAEVTTLKHRLEFATGAHVSARALGGGEAGAVTLTLDQAMPFDGHAVNRATGAFRLLDLESGEEAGFGIIDYALRRATNVVWHDTAVDKAVRAGLKGQKPVCLWFTGLSGSGKSTVANMVDKRLTAAGRHTYVLDGDNIRHGLNHDLGFTETDRVENIRRMAEVAKLMVDAGLIVMVCAISPYHRDREMARGLFEGGEFVEVFVDTPLAECETRDPKGLYQKARAGQIPNFTGISAPYEAPDAPDIHLDGTEPIDELVERVFAMLG